MVKKGEERNQSMLESLWLLFNTTTIDYFSFLSNFKPVFFFPLFLCSLVVVVVVRLKNVVNTKTQYINTDLFIYLLNLHDEKLTEGSPEQQCAQLTKFQTMINKVILSSA